MMPLVSLLLGLLVGASDAAQVRSWPQWGGPSRNFVAPATDLAQTWPASGPRQLWRRALGDGFSGIVTDGTLLYTLYRDGDDDVAVALRAEDGKTQWEARYPAPFTETCSERLGPVPRAAPLLAGDLLITTSAGGSMQSFDRRTGKPGWRIELIPPGSEAAKPCGYSSSPVQFGDAIITMAGGRLGDRLYMSSGDTGSAPFAAVDVNTGDILWRDRTVARASLIAAGGRLIILDENGLLVLAEPKDDGLRVLAQAQIFSGRAWTAPSLSGTRLYLRDRKEVVAVELGR